MDKCIKSNVLLNKLSKVYISTNLRVLKMLYFIYPNLQKRGFLEGFINMHTTRVVALVHDNFNKTYTIHN